MNSSPMKKKVHSGQDLIGRLPEECLLRIFGFLPDSQNRIACAAVSKRWLWLQAQMRITDFPVDQRIALLEHGEGTRYLVGKCANDFGLAAVLVAVSPPRFINKLNIMQSEPYTSLQPQQHLAVTDFGLRIVAAACPYLKSLALWKCIHVTDKSLSLISQSCKSLQELRLNQTVAVTDVGLRDVATRCFQLRCLELEACPQITIKSIKAIVEHSSQLQSVELNRCPEISTKAIILIVSKLPNLTKLMIASMKLDDDVLQALAKHGKSIRNVHLKKISNISGKGYAFMGTAESLEKLTLDSCHGLDDSSFTNTKEKSFTRVKKAIFIRCDSITDEGLLALSTRAKSLSNLKLEKCNKMTRIGIKHLMSNCFRSLKHLNIDKCNFAPAFDEPERQASQDPHRFPLLISLKLKNCNGVDDNFLNVLAVACMKLKHLSLVEMKNISDIGILAIVNNVGGVSAISSLEIIRCDGVNDCGVRLLMQVSRKIRNLTLASCGGLWDLSLSSACAMCPALLKLDLSNSAITDNGLEQLLKARKQNLEELWLRGCKQITDGGLQTIAAECNFSLRYLNLLRCSNITQQGVDWISEQLIVCEIEYS